jgi:hypothetical protein
MKFTSKELISIEQTVGKLSQAVSALSDYESTERTNMRYISFIIQEMRHCAKAYEQGARIDAIDRLGDLITTQETSDQS